MNSGQLAETFPLPLTQVRLLGFVQRTTTTRGRTSPCTRRRFCCRSTSTSLPPRRGCRSVQLPCWLPTISKQYGISPHDATARPYDDDTQANNAMLAALTQRVDMNPNGRARKVSLHTMSC